MTHLSITHRSTVTEDQIDHLGHMNVRFYGVNARLGTEAVLARLWAPSDLAFPLVDVYTRHHREQLRGARLAVQSGVLDAGPDAVRLYHELVNEDTGDLAATFVHRAEARTAQGERTGVPDAVVRQAAETTVEVPERGATRSLSLDADPTARPPSLSEVVERNLAMRKIRTIAADECGPDGRYLVDNAPALLWAGETLDGRDAVWLRDGPDGEKMGWASMETRMGVLRMPSVGDRIQSFGATVALGDKTSHVMLWAFDVDRGDLLAVFEVVSLAFDTVARRAMSIPDAVRAEERDRFHPDLAAI